MSVDPRRVLRIAHITDLHVQPEKGAIAGMQRCLEHAQAQKPDLLMMGGDMVMDCLETPRERVEVQWDSYSSVLSSHARTPVKHVIGNHDIWTGPEGTERGYALDRLGIESSYYSFDQAGWHLVVLDSTFLIPGGYTAKLDEAQFKWLEEDLKSAQNTPVAVFSHIPILSACAFLDGDNEATGDWRVPGAWMHIDVRRIKALFRLYPNINACFSGHIHLVERVDYLGISYYCNGAACGAWWNGPFQEFDAGYGIIDLYADGSLENNYLTFGWTPVP